MTVGGAAVASAADAENAANTRTVFIDKGLYTEDGDLEGIFVTYVRKAASP
jgi:hypothetical protein